MEFYNICIMLCILLSDSFRTVILAEEECQETHRNLKCTLNDKRDRVNHYCRMYTKDWSLWCRRSILEKIPEPNQIKPFKSCGNATALYIDDSCLREITEEQVQSYPNITTFLCGKNFIKKLPENLFAKNRKLKEINFCRNEIEEIHKNTFAGLSSLEILCLANNELTSVPDYSFEDLGSLRELSLHGNKIEELQAGVFQGLKKLRILKLTANKIKTIDGKAFWYLQSLTHLRLDENKLKVVNVGIFKPLSNLEVLTISYNTMETWGEVGENALGKVHTLNLASNLLSTFHSSHVRNMSKLQNLSLENNSLTSLADDTFTGTDQLRYIDVSGNSLENIGKHTFSNLCHLEILLLRDNKLNTPHAEWFTNVVNGTIEENDISKNKWNCNCEAIEYQKFLQMLETREKKDSELAPWSDVLSVTCSLPENLKNRPLDAETAKTIYETDCKVKNVNKETPCLPETTDFERVPETYKYNPTTKKKSITESTTAPIQTTTTLKNVANFEAETQEKRENGTWLLIPGVGAVLMLVVITIYIIIRRKISQNHSKTSLDDEEKAEMPNSRSDEGLYNHLNFEKPTPRTTTNIEKKFYNRHRGDETTPKLLYGDEQTEIEDDGYTPMKSMQM